MANWKQIQGRIRKARGSADPAAEMAQLYEGTRDAMVAYELARVHERAGRTGEAVEWYTTAFGRFRRTEWKKRAGEALARLGAPVPTLGEEAAPKGNALAGGREGVRTMAEAEEASPLMTSDEAPSIPASLGRDAAGTSSAGAAERQAGGIGRRRRGKRGGRGRSRDGRAAREAVTPSPVHTMETPEPAESGRHLRGGRPGRQQPAPGHDRKGEESYREKQPAAVTTTAEIPQSVFEGYERETLPPSRGGDPGLTSRAGRLEMQLRRLMACPVHNLDAADLAPAGPGVLALLDSDETTYYYIESCKSLRAALGQLMRSGRSAGKERPLRRDLATHLGISESQVTKYLKDHGRVRWLQLDEGAAWLEHFAIGVLQPALMSA